MGRLIITIDGPTASGKTTTAHKLAEKLGIFHLKGGIFLRSLTYYCISNNIKYEDAISKAAETIDLTISNKNNSVHKILLNGENVDEFLWTYEVDKFVSFVAKIPYVRSIRKKWLRNTSNQLDLVADGRTLGSEIFPEATVKFQLICDLEQRAYRRYKQYDNKNSLVDIQNAICKRDNDDSKGSVNRLTPPKGAIVIDSTNLTQTEVVETMYTFVKSNVS